MRFFVLVCLLSLVASCQRLEDVGEVPAFTPNHRAAESLSFATGADRSRRTEWSQGGGSLWSRGEDSLFGDRRAARPGDILTVVIEIDDRAEFSNNTSRNRSGSESVAAPTFFGLEALVDDLLPGQASLESGLSTNSTSTVTGDGSVKRNEKLTLRVAATVVERLDNGVIRIEGSQEVRVNFEIRELLVSGYVRPADITRRNEVTYDKIAAARISYGGRGLISSAQRPRRGQEAADVVLPF